MKLAPVVVFTYNRLQHTQRVVESLERNELAKDTDLFFYSDKYDRRNKKKVEEVRAYLQEYAKRSNFRKVTIVEAKEHQGLAKSIIRGVTEVIEKYKQIIVIEDDLEVSYDFLEYMNSALRYYRYNKKIWSITGFSPIDAEEIHFYQKDVFMAYRGHSLGWGSWIDRWKQVDWDIKDYWLFKYNPFARAKFNRGGSDMANMLDWQMQGKVDSWAIRWNYTESKLNTLTVYPKEKRVLHWGLDGTGVHCEKSKQNGGILLSEYKTCEFIEPYIDKRVNKIFRGQIY